MKVKLIILLIFCSCSSPYIVLDYKELKQVYVLKRTKFPRINRTIPSDKPCSCMVIGDTISFITVNDSLVPIKK